MRALVLDLDSTLWPFELGVRTFPRLGDLDLAALDGWDAMWHEIARRGIEPHAAFAHAFELRTQLAVGLYDGAAAAVRRLRAELPARIVVMTHRHAGRTADTEAFLERAGVPVDELLCAPSEDLDKLAEARARRPLVIVDDHPGLLRAAATGGVPCAALRHPWNAAVLDELAIPHATAWTGADGLEAVIRRTITAA